MTGKASTFDMSAMIKEIWEKVQKLDVLDTQVGNMNDSYWQTELPGAANLDAEL